MGVQPSTSAAALPTDPSGVVHSGNTNPWLQYAGVPEPQQYALYSQIFWEIPNKTHDQPDDERHIDNRVCQDRSHKGTQQTDHIQKGKEWE